MFFQINRTFALAMKKILKVDSPNDFARFVDAPELHPLISIIHFDELAPFRHSLNNYGVYGLFIQRQFPKDLSYGMKTVQASDASIIAVEPGQIGGLEDNGERISLSGWVLLWSPELLHGSELEHQIDRYQYFSYFFTGSMRMEPDEWLCITQLLAQMRQELITQQLYFRENRQLTQGLPTVAYCASELAYSPRYFGDIVHKATGGTAIGYIHNYVINQAKSLLMNGHNISETSRLLGFDFPHHFTRLFKKVTGLTPSEYLGK